MATINAISVALFNAAAGGYSAEMTANGAAFANAVGPVLEKDISTDALFVEHLLGNLGVASTNAVYAQAKAAVAGLVTAKGRLGATVDAIDFLKAQEGSTSAYAVIAANFAAKVNSAAAYTAANATERDITKLISGVTGIDTDAAAVAAAVAAQKAADDTAAAAAVAKAAADAASAAKAAAEKVAADAAAAAKTAADAASTKAAADAAATAKAAAEKVAADAAAAAKTAADEAAVKAAADATAAAQKAAADAAAVTKAAADAAAAKAAADLAAVDNTTYASEQAALDAANAAAATAAAAAKTAADAAAAKAASDLAAANLTITTLQNPAGSTTTLTTSDDVFVGIKGGNDVVTAAEANIEGDVDVIVDGSSTDSDTINFAATTFSSTLDTAGAVIRGFENINVSFNSLVASTFEADGIGSTSTITVTQSRSGGSGDITVSDVADGTTVVAGASVTDLTVDTVAATDNSVVVNGGAATGAISVTVAQAGTATVTGNSAAHITVAGDDGNITINSTSATEIDETASGGSVVINAPAATDVAATTSGSGTVTITAEGSTGVTYTAKTATVTVTGIDAIVTSTGVGTADTLTVTSTNDVTVANQAAKVETIKVGGTSQAINSTITTTAATTYYALGAQNVTFKGNSTMFDGKTFVDSSTGTSTVKFTTFATADVSKIASDVIDVNATAAAAATLSANNNTNVKLSANINAGGLTIDGDNDSSTVDLSGTVNLTLSSDITGGTLTIDNSATGDDGFDVVNLTLTAAQTSLDLQADAAAVTVTGSKALTLDNTSTAATFVASAVTAAVSAEVNATFKKVTTGSGSDTLVLNTTSATSVVDSGSGNDLVQVGVAFAGNVTGGSGSDTLEFTGSVDVSAATVSGFEYIDVNANTATIDDDVLNGASIVIDGTGTVQVKNIKSNLDLSALSFASTAATNVDFTARNDGTLGQSAGISITGSAKVDTIVTGNGSNSVTGGAGNDSITGGTGVDTILGEAGNDTIIGSGGTDYLDGGDGDDTITGGSVVDTIIAGKGADTVTGGLGADVINLTETVASIDTVVLTTGGAIAVDAITGFAAGTAGDIVKIDLSDINALVTDLNLAGNFATGASADAAPTLATVSAAYDVGTAATADILVISGDFTASTLETALEVGGSRALTGNGTHSAGDAFLVVYDNGTDTYIAYVSSVAGIADNATFAADDLTVTNIARLVGVSDATTVVADNLQIVA